MLYDPKWEVKTKPVEKWRQILLDAADLIRRRGLAKGVQLAKDGSMCTQGAISVAATGVTYSTRSHPEYCAATDAVLAELKETGQGEYKYGAAEWNNHPHRTKEEVIWVLERAAAR